MSRPSDWAVVYDCDGTLIPKMVGALMPVVAQLGLAEEATEEMNAVHSKYVVLFDAGVITGAQYRGWLMEEFELYVRHRLTAAAWQSALAHVRLRPGVVELMGELHAAGVRQCVISGAVAEFVEYVLEINGARHLVDAVYAAKLLHDPRGTVIGYDEDSFVHLENKGEWSMYFAGLHRIDPRRIVALGDSIGDARLGHLRANRIGIAETREHAEALAALGVMGQVVLVDDHLEPASSAIKRLLGLPF